MSAILDALKRQEEERRRGQAATESAAERLLTQRPKPQRTGLGAGLATALGVLIIGGLTFALLTANDSAAPQSAPGVIAPDVPTPADPSTPTFDAALAPTNGAPKASAGTPGRAPAPLATIVDRWRVSAHIYGELKDDRALWINGRPYGEGDEIDGLTLEAITAEGYRVRRGEERLTRRITPP
ncbi:MAG: general secretion pathway protein GspB [Pseudomonadales bacterium]